MPDVEVQAEGGSLYLFHLLTSRAREWVQENVPGETTFWAGSLVVEHRYAGDLAIGMLDDGLEVV
ncbi:hypothetical protein LCGC14_2096760 [marine sediment metagenome]|uniref:Uncharacterized protein n=1 Tax=marine sediment metagenome TaxID=412755 RepID=A0A0F9GPE8_9ZZZZ